MARGSKFWIKKVEGQYYLCSENKGFDQLRGYREADLRLCFCICKNQVFSRRDSVGSVSRLAFKSSQVQFPVPAHFFHQLSVTGERMSSEYGQ